ncbi:uncharacterized protein LOC106131090 isoform X1 [Amyelois transitella]|uniref:uncharacterized protein LOC106131090 isoform X1 n=1 Tax=Amyelois transitella TaxID=680683 RepID=UPI00298FCE7A|nr:uncharacterized protein LOC106131090 isoform X1 [Amyelois transitella]
MAVTPMIPVLLFAVFSKCGGDSSGHKHGNGASQFGELLKPPPPPPHSPIQPVPFHGGGRVQRQNLDTGYHYPPPPPPSPSSDFKFPAPFYKQYNFNFVPPPQPFTTTPSPSLFQKVSGWLFSTQQSNQDTNSILTHNVAPIKKDCNPCNQVPWIPVIRYNLGAKNTFQSPNPTYGPPSPTAYPNALSLPQPLLSTQKTPQLLPGIPHTVYGPPVSFQNSFSSGFASSTYGPPSPTHTITVSSHNSISTPFSSSNSYSPPSSPFNLPSSTYGVPSSSYGVPSNSYETPSNSYGAPSSSYNVPSSSYGVPSSSYGVPSSSYGAPSSSFSIIPSQEVSSFNSNTGPYSQPSSTYRTPTNIFSGTLTTPSSYISSTYAPVTAHYEPVTELELPKVSPPAVFKNSYGELISNPNALNIPSATAAESTKIKTQVLPNDNIKYPIPNGTLALANPAPFSLNRGRNIHTLQPVALPNLSVSPLPPIFNARPFRPSPKFESNVVQGINSMQQTSHNVHISPSVPIAEFTHSIDYPATVIQSPVIDIDILRNQNRSKSYRNDPNSFIDDIRDISSQASEDHISETKSIPDASFESTGIDGGNDIYDTGVPSDLKPVSVPSNHRPAFADLRGVKDEDVDKYRTENNLQNIDSPLLYLKPSAPHKNHGNFAYILSTTSSGNDYEIYDEAQTTSAPQSAQTSSWHESQVDFNESPSNQEIHEHADKPKIVQIIVPYTTNKELGGLNLNFDSESQDWSLKEDDEYQARKIPTNTESPYISTVTENYSTTEESTPTSTESTDSDHLNTADILNDLYDVKEPPFDIIKLQQTIDDWTAQEYSKRHKIPQRSRNVEKYAKQIPDDFFTTTTPTNYVTSTIDYSYELYDHEGSSSMQHAVTEDKNNSSIRGWKHYNTIERTKSKYNVEKNKKEDEVQKLHIYTAASTFRSTTTTTPAPWGKIETSISPLTKEKVYVVTSKPWRDSRNITKEWFDPDSFEFKKIRGDNEASASDNLPFKSPRFSNRPSTGFASIEKTESMKSDSSYGFSKSWYQSINDLENRDQRSNTALPEGFQQTHFTNEDEGTMDTTTAGHHRDA